MKIKDILDNCEKKEGDIYSFIKSLKSINVEHKLNKYFDFESIKDCKFKVYNLYKYMSDERRGIWINVAYFEENLVSFWYSAGREGDDSYNHFVLNKEYFLKSIKYLEEISLTEEDYEIFEYLIDEEIKELDYLYGADMSKLLLNLNLDLKYKIGDIVNLNIEEDKNLFPEIEKTYLRGEITYIDPKSSACSYKIKILDYKEIICFNGKNTKRNLFLKTDVLNYTDLFNTDIPFLELSKDQKDTIIKYMFEKVKHMIIDLSYIEENKISKIIDLSYTE